MFIFKLDRIKNRKHIFHVFKTFIAPFRFGLTLLMNQSCYVIGNNLCTQFIRHTPGDIFTLIITSLPQPFLVQRDGNNKVDTLEIGRLFYNTSILSSEKLGQGITILIFNVMDDLLYTRAPCKIEVRAHLVDWYSGF